jgi:gliding motility-associated lipoprotein GldH
MLKTGKISMGLLCLTSLMSCIDSPIINKYVSVDTKGWQSTDTVNIEISSQKNAADANISIRVRTTEDYPYKDLHMRVTIKSNGKKLSTTDTKINIYDKNGETTGKGFPYIENRSTTPILMKLETDSNYTVCITHLMETVNLCGISDVGINVDKVCK